MTGKSRLFATHRCAVKGCPHVLARRHFVCADHYAMVPKWLQTKIAEQLRYGIAWKCHPTQEYLDLRSQAVAWVIRKSAEKYAAPTPDPQLPLLVS
jgi:hypothetical protein